MRGWVGLGSLDVDVFVGRLESGNREELPSLIRESGGQHEDRCGAYVTPKAGGGATVTCNDGVDQRFNSRLGRNGICCHQEGLQRRVHYRDPMCQAMEKQKPKQNWARHARAPVFHLPEGHMASPMRTRFDSLSGGAAPAARHHELHRAVSCTRWAPVPAGSAGILAPAQLAHPGLPAMQRKRGRLDCAMMARGRDSRGRGGGGSWCKASVHPGEPCRACMHLVINKLCPCIGGRSLTDIGRVEQKVASCRGGDRQHGSSSPLERATRNPKAD